MIVYLVTKRHRYTIEKFLDGWVPWLRPSVQVMTYKQLLQSQSLWPATYIFSDLERLRGEHKIAVKEAHARLLDNSSRVLNDPARSLMRFDLLRTLRDLKVNDFSAYRLVDRRQPGRFPVFIREEDEHRILTPLLYDQDELDKAIARLYLRRRGLDKLLVVEFRDTADESGEFCKYSAFAIGEEIIPKHVFFSRNWLLKQADIVDSDRLRAEKEYLETNPHEGEVRRIFEIAKIDYGRIDYAMADGRIQVWEINTNPMILAPSDRVRTDRLPFKEMTSQQIAAAFQSINGSPPVPESPTISGSPVTTGQQRRPPNAGTRLRRRVARKSRALSIPIIDAVATLCWRPLIALLENTRWR